MANLATVVKLEVATPKGLALRTEANSVQAPSSLGEFGVLPGHIPVLATLRSGVLRWKQGDGSVEVAAVGPGFVEAEPSSVQVLTDLFVRPKDIDADAVRKEREEAEKELKAYEGNEDAKYTELQRAVEWAQARLDAVRAAES